MPNEKRSSVFKCTSCGGGFVLDNGTYLPIQQDVWTRMQHFWIAKEKEEADKQKDASLRQEFQYSEAVSSTQPQEIAPGAEEVNRKKNPVVPRAADTLENAQRYLREAEVQSATTSDQSWIIGLASFVALFFFVLAVYEFSYSSENDSDLARVLAWGYVLCTAISVIVAVAAQAVSKQRAIQQSIIRSLKEILDSKDED